MLGIRVEHGDPNLAPVAGVHRAGGVDDRDSVPIRQAGPWDNECQVAVGQRDRDPGSDSRPRAGRELERLGRVKVGASVTRMGICGYLTQRDKHLDVVCHVTRVVQIHVQDAQLWPEHGV